VKPQNVLLAPSGPKLADLGVIRVDDPTDPDAGALTASGAVPGTLRFLAPEVIFGQPAGPKADAYALAMVAYEALTGRSPRPAMTLGELVHGAWEPVTLVSAARPKLGTSFDAPFAAALDLDPNRRLGPLAFAAELWQAVTAWAAAPAVATDAARPAGTDDAPTVLDGVAAPDAADDSAPSAGTATEGSIPEAHTTAAAGAVETEGVADAVTAPAAPITEVAALSGIARPNPTAFLPGEDTTGVDRPAGRRPRVLPESVRAEPVSQVLVALVIVAVVLGLVVVGLLVTQGGSTPAATAPGASGPDASGSGPASSAAATPSPTAPDPAAAARQALEDVKAAIEQARGGRDGLKGADANELADLADDIGRALEAGDYESAHSATEKLAERVDKVGDELDKASRDALVRAVDALLTAIPPA
jgi:serine/threonine-protein kinase